MIVLVVIVRRGVHLSTIFRGFLFYIQVSTVAVAYLPDTFYLFTEVVRMFDTKEQQAYNMTYYNMTLG